MRRVWLDRNRRNLIGKIIFFTGGTSLIFGVTCIVMSHFYK